MSSRTERIIDGVNGEGIPGELSDPEVLDPASVEVRFGDPKADASRLRELFIQETTIEHLADIRPDIKAREISILYKDPSLVLLTAETPEGIIVGTYSLQRPGRGSRAAEGMRLAVDENYRRLGIASKLVKAGNALMFTDEENGGFDANLAQVFVIIKIAGDGRPLRVFGREGYLRGTEREEATRSWSNELQELVVRNSQPMTLQRRTYIQNFPRDHIEFFPKPRPPR